MTIGKLISMAVSRTSGRAFSKHGDFDFRTERVNTHLRPWTSLAEASDSRPIAHTTLYVSRDGCGMQRTGCCSCCRVRSLPCPYGDKCLIERSREARRCARGMRYRLAMWSFPSVSSQPSTVINSPDTREIDHPKRYATCQENRTGEARRHAQVLM